MKYLIASDIHGSLTALQRVLQYFDDQHCDMLCLLGDLLNYGPRNGLPSGLDAPGVARLLGERAHQIIAVRGNCDSEVDQMLLPFPMMSDYALLVDNGKRLFLTHGHVFNDSHLPPPGSCEYFLFGHTHLPFIRPAEGKEPCICNVGSPTFPKGGNPPTFAIYEDGHVRLVDLCQI